MQDDVWFDQHFEVRFLNLNAIASGRQIGQRIFSHRVGLPLIPNIRVRANDRELGGNDPSFGSVGYTAGERGVRRLSAESSSEHRESEDREKRSKHNFSETPEQKSGPLGRGRQLYFGTT